jgi:hypothetical protein
MTVRPEGVGEVGPTDLFESRVVDDLQKPDQPGHWQSRCDMQQKDDFCQANSVS